MGAPSGLAMHTLAGGLALVLATLLPSGAVAEPARPVETLVAEALEARFAGSLPDGDIVVALANPPAAPASAVETLRFDPRSGRLAAIVVAGGRRVAVDGEAWSEIDVAVPNRRVRAGEILGDADLSTLRVRADRLSGRTVVDAEDLVGREARRALAPGKPVQATAVGAPVLVRRNQAVTLVDRHGGLELRARGRALEDGGMGDLVRVMNADSNRTLTGTVTADGEISTSP